jgi:hypothetical protein
MNSSLTNALSLSHISIPQATSTPIRTAPMHKDNGNKRRFPALSFLDDEHLPHKQRLVQSDSLSATTSSFDEESGHLSVSEHNMDTVVGHENHAATFNVDSLKKISHQELGEVKHFRLFG